jgi:hypothetical protein
MNLSLQDLLAIWGPSLMLTGFMWHHFNKKFDDLKAEVKDVRVDIKRVEEKLGADIKRVEEKLGADIKRVEEKVDAVRDRVSRIEGQLVPAKVVSFEETRKQPTSRPIHSKAAQAH